MNQVGVLPVAGWRQSVLLADVLLLLAAAVWGSSYAAVKGALAFYPVLGFLALRFGLTFILLLPAWRGVPWPQRWRACRAGGALGLLLWLIFLCETWGVALTLASNAAFLISLCVVFTPFAEWWLCGSRPVPAAWGAVLLSVLGAFLMLSGGSLSAFGIGDGLMLLAALLRAIGVTLTKRLTQQGHVPTLPLTAVQLGTVGALSLLLCLSLPGAGLPPLPASPVFWSATLYLIGACTIFAFLAQNHAVQHRSPTHVALLMGSEPVFGALFALVWLGEQLTPQAWLGGGLIVAAALWASLWRR